MRGSLSKRSARVIAAAALLLAAINAILAINRTTLTTDELVHIAAGYYSLSIGEFRMNAEHPPLAKMVAAAPLFLFLPPDQGPESSTGNFSIRGGEYRNHFWHVYRDSFLRITFWSRAAMVSFMIALGALLFHSTQRWFGPTAAALAVVLYSLEPTVLGHGRLVHTDLPAAFMFLLFFVALDAYWRKPSLRRVALLALATALAMLTKFSMIVLLPVLAGFFGALLWKSGRGLRRTLLVHPFIAALVFVLAIQAGYRFRNPPLGPDTTWIEEDARDAAPVLQSIQALSSIFPRDFLFGIYVVAWHNSGGHPSSILGRYGTQGWWYYFPVAFAFKTSLAFLLLSVTSLLWALWRIRQREFRFLMAVIPFAIYLALAMSGGINIGIRHFLPAFPFLFMLSGALLAEVSRQRTAGLLASGLAIGVMGFEAAANFPYYLSYMNQLKGKDPGWRYLSDSNVEWGDAVPELAAYLRERGETRVSGALLGGNMTLQYFGIEFVDMHRRPADTRYIALGASLLNGSTVEYGDLASGRGTEPERVNYFSAYIDRKPVAVIGNSIYVFDNPERGR